MEVVAIDIEFLTNLVNSRYEKQCKVEDVGGYLYEVDSAIEDCKFFTVEFKDALMFCELVCRTLGNLTDDEKKQLIETLKAQREKDLEGYQKLEDIPF